MANMQAMGVLVQFIAENFAIFFGGLFSGAAIYICLTEHPPRTMLLFADLLALSRSNAQRTNALLTTLAAVTALTASVSSLVGASIWWFVGGAAHLAAVIILHTKIAPLAKELSALDTDRDSEALGQKLLQRQAAYFSLLALVGLFSQYLFIAQL